MVRIGPQAYLNGRHLMASNKKLSCRWQTARRV